MRKLQGIDRLTRFGVEDTLDAVVVEIICIYPITLSFVCLSVQSLNS